ncbi:MAG: O-antigen ligase family protein [Prevotellaceae bacterium]|jgi:O-antigen ligase|nr:O-antigen ligase family protein [Prevotellaceae bacterium]
MKNSIITKAAIYLYLLYCLSPFVWYSKTIIPETEYISVSGIFAVVLYILSVIELLRQKAIHISKIDIWILIWTVCLTISFFVMRHASGTADYITLSVYITPVFLYFLFRSTNFLLDIRHLSVIIILSVLLQVIFCIRYQTSVFQSNTQFRATFFNSGLFGGFISVGVVTAISLLVFSKAKGYRRIITTGVLLAILCLFIYWLRMTGSRAALIALFVSLPFLMFKRLALSNTTITIQLKKYKLYLGILGLILFVSAGYYLYGIRPHSATGRLYIWQTSVEMIKEKPIFGYGLDGFRKNYMFHQAKFLEQDPGSPFAQLASDTAFSFNELVKIGVEQGITGLLIILFLIGIIFTAKSKQHISQRSSLAILKTILLAILVFGLFSYPSESFRFRLIVVIIMAMAASMASGKTTIRFNSGKYIAVIALAGFTVMGYWGLQSYEFFVASNKFNDIYHSQDNNIKQTEQLEVLYPQLNSTIEYLSFYGRLLADEKPEQALILFLRQETIFPSSSQQMDKGKAYHLLEMTQQADSAWLLASKMMPELVRPHYMLAKSYYDRHEYEKACYHANIVLNRKPKVYTPEVYYMRKDMEKMAVCK